LRQLFALAFFILVGCGQDDNNQLDQVNHSASRIPVVFTVNYPLYWMAEQLTGDAATVVFPAPAGEDPAFWRPDIETLLDYQQADLVLLNGAGYARWLANASLPDSRLVDTSMAYRDQLIATDSAPVHSHGPQGDHSHGELAFTTWLDLAMAGQQAQAIADALRRLLPGHSAAIDQRLESLHRTLAAMDVQLTGLGEALDKAPLLYSHPVYQYLQRRYQLNGKALHWEPDATPNESQWATLESILNSHPAQLMLWEGQPLPEVRQRLGEMGIKIIVFAPLANRPRQGNFSTNMAGNIAALQEQVQGGLPNDYTD
jgi:zinc transport system substrate-binding protein